MTCRFMARPAKYLELKIALDMSTLTKELANGPKGWEISNGSLLCLVTCRTSTSVVRYSHIIGSMIKEVRTGS